MNDGDSPRLVKYGVAAVLLALYAGLSAWLVAGEGEAYRKSIAKKSTSEASPLVASDPQTGPIAVPEKSTPPVPEPAPVAAPAPPSAVVKEPKPNPAVARADRSPAAPAKKAAPPPPIDTFWDEPDQQKVWDLDKLTVDDERQLGDTLHRMVLHDHAEIDEGPLPGRLKAAAKPYLAGVTRKEVKYTFTVLDCPRMNVFSHPGGYIYVCRGLFDWIAEDEDYALGFILAHEIAHVDMTHALACLRDPDVKKNFKFGTSLLFYAVMIPAGYLEQQDLEADRWAATQMFKAGKSRYETLAFLRRLEDYAKSNGFENKRRSPKDKPPVPLLDNHIRAHPIPSERLEEVKAFIGRFQKI